MEEEGFARELKEIKLAEAEKAKILAGGQKDAQAAISKAEQEAAKIIAKGRELAKSEEDKILAAARAQMDEEEKKTVSKAGQQAERIHGMMVTESVVKMGIKKLVE